MASHSLVVEGSSETSPRVILHPLVLVTVSDHGTRAALQNKLPVFGAILGENNSKELTLEIAFECGIDALTFANGAPVLDADWFSTMIQDRTSWNMQTQADKLRHCNSSNPVSCRMVFVWHRAKTMAFIRAGPATSRF
jgi:hypothetical protein